MANKIYNVIMLILLFLASRILAISQESEEIPARSFKD